MSTTKQRRTILDKLASAILDVEFSFFSLSFSFCPIFFIENGAPNLSHNPIEKKFLTNGTGHCESLCLVSSLRFVERGKEIVQSYLKILLDKVTSLSTFLHAGNVRLKLGRNVKRWSKIMLYEIINAFD